jgi:hypothetical protein
MPKARKKNKQLIIEDHTQDTLPDEPIAREDLVGKFLVSVAIAFVTGLITQAISDQVNWIIVALAFVVSLIVLLAYQKFG